MKSLLNQNYNSLGDPNKDYGFAGAIKTLLYVFLGVVTLELIYYVALLIFFIVLVLAIIFSLLNFKNVIFDKKLKKNE